MIPPVFARDWRAGFAGLLVLAATEAAALVAAALLLRALSRNAAGDGDPAWLAGALAGAGLAAGLLAWMRGVAAEAFGMRLAAHLRRRLAAHAVDVAGAGAPRRLGVIAARMGADVNAVRDWVAVGLCDAAAGVAFVAGGLGALALIGGPRVAAVGLAVAGLSFVIMGVAAPALYAATETLRRERGRVSGLAGDIAVAAGALARFDPKAREAKRLDARSARLSEAAVRRRSWAGGALIVPAAATALGVGLVSVTLTASGDGPRAAADWTGIVFAFVLLGGGLAALAKGVDAHAGFSAARRRFQRLEAEAEAARPTGPSDRGWPSGPVTVALHPSSPSHPAAGPGDVVRVHAGAPGASCALVEALATADTTLHLNDRPLGALRPNVRARRVALSAPSAPLLRASVRRNLTLARGRDDRGPSLEDALRWCGLEPDDYPPDQRIEPVRAAPDAFADARLRLARAVAGGARVILVAEPALYGLDDTPTLLARIAAQSGATVIAAAPAGLPNDAEPWTHTWDLTDVQPFAAVTPASVCVDEDAA